MSGERRTHRLPGDPSPAAVVARMLRVDQAGEYGAARIYDGQLAVLGRARSGAAIRAMAEQEKRHLAEFDRWSSPAASARPCCRRCGTPPASRSAPPPR